MKKTILLFFMLCSAVSFAQSGGMILTNGYVGCTFINCTGPGVYECRADSVGFVNCYVGKNSVIKSSTTSNAVVRNGYVGNEVEVDAPTVLLDGFTVFNSNFSIPTPSYWIYTPNTKVDLSIASNVTNCFYTGSHTASGDEVGLSFIGVTTGTTPSYIEVWDSTISRITLHAAGLFYTGLSNIGGMWYTGAGNLVTQTGSGTSSQILIGGSHPSFGNVPLAAISGLTNTQLSGSAAISNANIANPNISIFGTPVALGANYTTPIPSASVSQDSSQWSLDNASGNIQNKNAGGVTFNGTANFTNDISADGGFVQFNNGAHFGNAAPVYIKDQIYTTTDAGLYSSNADEQIATFDISTGQYVYGNGEITVNGGTIGIPSYTINGGILTTDGSGNLVQLTTGSAHRYRNGINTLTSIDLTQDVANVGSPGNGFTGVSNSGTITVGGNVNISAGFTTTGSGSPTLAFPAGSFTYTFPLASSTLFANNLGLSGGSIHIGSTSTNSGLTLRSTSGVGAAGADIIFQTGNNGTTEVGRFLNAGQFGVGVSSPTAMLHLKAGTATASTAPLKFNSGTNLTSPEAGAMEFDGTNLYFSPSTTRYRVIGIGTPTIAAGVGAGTSPTISVAGNDGAMTVSVTTGTLPTGTNAVVATITFNKSWGSTPRVVFSPANAITATLSGVSMVFMDAAASTTTYVITSGTTALTAATAYKWNVHCIQ